MKQKKIIIVFILIFVLSFTVLLTGCDALNLINSGSSTSSVATKSEKVAVSYVSTDSKVYSSTAEVVKAVADTVVEISTESVVTSWGRQYISSGAGSGVIIAVSYNTYYIVTNNHVIEGVNDITVTTRDGVTYNASLIATDDSADIAVVSIKSNTELSVAVIGNSDDLQIGEDLIAIGNPLGSLGGTVTKGILSATGRSKVI